MEICGRGAVSDVGGVCAGGDDDDDDDDDAELRCDSSSLSFFCFFSLEGGRA